MAGLGTAMNGETAAQAPGVQVPAGPDDELGQEGRPASPEEERLLAAWLNKCMDVLSPEPGQINPRIFENLKGDFDEQAAALFANADPPLDLKGNPKDALAATGTLLLIMVDSQMGYQLKANKEGDSEGPADEQGAADEAEPPEDPAEEQGEPADMKDEGSAEASYTAVLMECGQQVLQMLAGVDEQAGIAKLEQQDVDYIWLRAMDLYRLASPTLDHAAMKKAFLDLEDASKQGKLPGFEGMNDTPQDSNVLPGLPGGAAMPPQGPRGLGMGG